MMLKTMFDAARTQAKTVNVSLTVIIVYLIVMSFSGTNMFGGVRLVSIREYPGMGTLVDGEAPRESVCARANPKRFPRVEDAKEVYGPWIVSADNDEPTVRCRWLFLDLPEGQKL